MKKHLLAATAVAVITLAGFLSYRAYALATRLITQTTQSVAVTGSNGTATTQRTDTIAIASDMGKYSQMQFALTIQVTDSIGEESATAGADLIRCVFYGVNKGIYTILDTLNITGLTADSARNAVKTVEWSDSLGVSRLRGYQLVMTRLIQDTANKAATLGSDSAFNYNVSWNAYLTE